MPVRLSPNHSLSGQHERTLASYALSWSGGKDSALALWTYDKLIFVKPVEITLGEAVIREGFVFQDLLSVAPAGMPRDMP